MAQRCARRVIAVVVLIAFATGSGVAQTGGGILYPSEGVRLNGGAVVVSAAVSNGSQIQTAGSPALITAPGSTVQLMANTTLVFGSVLQLGCGGTVVTTSRGVSIRAGGLTVTAGRADSKFEVLNGAGKIDVVVHSGTVQIAQSDGTSLLQAGQSVSRPGDPACPATTWGSSQTTQTAARTINRKLVILAAAGGGAAVAAVLATRKTPSPTAP